MAGRITTHELADLLGRLQEALREAPDLPLADALKGFGVALPRRPRRAPPTEPMPPLDPTGLGREELAALLQDKRRFRTKKALDDSITANLKAAIEAFKPMFRAE